MRKCYPFCTNMNQHEPHGTEHGLKIMLPPGRMRNCQTSCTKTHLNVPHGGNNQNAVIYK